MNTFSGLIRPFSGLILPSFSYPVVDNIDREGYFDLEGCLGQMLIYKSFIINLSVRMIMTLRGSLGQNPLGQNSSTRPFEKILTLRVCRG